MARFQVDKERHKNGKLKKAGRVFIWEWADSVATFSMTKREATELRDKLTKILEEK